MKSKIFFLFLLAIGFLVFLQNSVKDAQEVDPFQILRSKHQKALEKSPFKHNRHYSKNERYDLGLPPNRYNEELWELTLDPSTGRPMPERLWEIKQDLSYARAVARGVGDETNPWIDRGPNNGGGRTRGILFDPNDTSDYNRVFAGGVSGGLWVNEDITSPNSSWSLVEGVDGSLAVNTITYDPNDPQVLYIGTGESYTSGDAVGSGIWKSSDGGITWENVFGGYDGVSGNNVRGIFYINDVVARNNDGLTEIYIAVSSAIFRYSDNPRQSMGRESIGVYKSTDGGDNWTRLDIKKSNGSYKNPNDLEIDSNNNVWVTTTRNIDGSPGGDIYKSTDGTNFTLVNTIPNARRTELEISVNTPNLMWVAADVNGKADLFKSIDGFSTYSKMNEPDDADTGIPTEDFAREQSFYDLVIEADSDDNLYVGGINLFRSTDGGNSWSQLTKWQNGTPELAALSISLVHADQHAVVFRPNDENEIVIGNDGGIYYSDNIQVAEFNSNAIEPRDKGYNTVQFYFGAIDLNGDSFGGGTQDNGTPIVLGASEGSNPFSDYFGGDGAYTEINADDGYMIQSYYYNNHRWVNYPDINQAYDITTVKTDENYNGSFINVAELDRNLNILYSNATLGNNYRIEKVTNFLNGAENIESEFLNHPSLNDSPSAMKSSPFAEETSNLYIGTKNGRLLRVVIDGSLKTWSEITGPGFVGSISDIEFGESELDIFVTFHNYGINNIWATNDGGSSWRNIEGNLPDLPVKCILQNPLEPTELIIGTQLGVWITQDYTVTNPVWNQSYNGMKDVPVVDLDLRPSDNLVLATTHGRGMFTSNFTSNSLGNEDYQANRNQITIFPTVNNGELFLKSNRVSGNALVQVYDISGKRLLTRNDNLSINPTRVALQLSPGLYFVNITVNNYIETKRIIVQ